MHTEIAFEDEIESALIQHGGYESDSPKDYDPDLALFPKRVIAFVQATQPKIWDRLVAFDAERADALLIESLSKELDAKGSLAVLRSGFKCFGKTVKLAFFAPNLKIDPDAMRRFEHNQLTIVRQVRTQTGAVVDITLCVNGLPVATLELKNPLSATGWTVDDAKQQYCTDRDPNDPLFAFRRRCLVHFAVDTEQVFMTTKLEGNNTHFLPFNLGLNLGAGNPPVSGNVRTGYLWQHILPRESFMDILAQFVLFKVEEKRVTTEQGIKWVKKEKLIFPRYHQLDVVRALIADAKKQGAGHNYLIQHSAGSGKTNSIAWLAYQLSSLHNDQNEKIFHSVIVITDRRVLDKQLQDTIYDIDHKTGVVEKIDKDTQQLTRAIASGAPIIVSTIQKFPFITQAIRTLEKKGESIQIDTAGKRFAIIVDEAHSSQTGESAQELRKILNYDGIESVIAEQLLDIDEDDGLSVEARKERMREQLKRTKQPNLSYFAFTATPKEKTLAIFDEPGQNGESPFHLYSMRQAIEEGFILDVLQHYTCYKRYHQLIHNIEHNPNVPRRKAAQALVRFVNFHDYDIEQKVEIIVEHFKTHTKHRIGGHAKAMVVTNSREHAVRYKLEFDKYLKRNGYSDIRSLVAFSGEVKIKKYPDQIFTESKLNGGIRETELPEKFESDDYQVLLVAEKYQTGFDQPLLHTMYVDKRLSGLHAVQTLSRLNRTYPGKTETFVLDFVNSPEDIYEAFKPYYEVTAKGEDADPQQLNTLSYELFNAQIFTEQEVTEWCEIWFRNRRNPIGGEHKKLNSILDLAVERFKQLSPPEQDVFKNRLEGFKNLYNLLSQIIPYQDSEWEKLFSYVKFLIRKLPRTQDLDAIDITGDVELSAYRLQKISEGRIVLRADDAPAVVYGARAIGTRKKSIEIALSLLVSELNEACGAGLTEADQLFFEAIKIAALKDDMLVQAGKVNTLENFESVLDKTIDSLSFGRLKGNEGVFMRMMNDKGFRSIILSRMAKILYLEINEQFKEEH